MKGQHHGAGGKKGKGRLPQMEEKQGQGVRYREDRSKKRQRIGIRFSGKHLGNAASEHIGADCGEKDKQPQPNGEKRGCGQEVPKERDKAALH